MISSTEPHCLVRIAFPHLPLDDCGPRRQGELYDHAIRPAAMFFQHSREAEWPATFQIAEMEGRRPNGSVVSRTNLVSALDVPEFGEAVLNACNSSPALPWARDAFFIHQIRGVKAITSMEVDHPQISPRRAAKNLALSLDLLLEVFTKDPFRDPFDQAYVDVGLEVSCPNHVLTWAKDKHDNLTDFVIHDASSASKLTKMGHRGYWCDYTCLLTDAAGFRASIPPQDAGPYGATYIQAYCTEKHLSSVPDQTVVARHLYPKDVLDQNNKATSTIQNMYDQCFSACEEQINANARLEARIDLQSASHALPMIDAETLKACVLKFKASSWW